jgi:hypothetical protein
MEPVEFGICPECGGLLGAEVVRGLGPVMATHTSPTCVRFDRMEAGDFLRWVMDVRDEMRRPRGEA